MDPQNQTTSLQRLQNVEKRIVRVLELAGGVLEEIANLVAPGRRLLTAIADIQMMLREEIKSTCNNHPFEKCDYVPRISNEICCKKLEYVIAHLDGM